MGREKRKRTRIPKKERRNLRFWAEGARETILTPHLDEYTIALDKGWREERKYLKQVCNEFHARVDWKLEDHEEPVLRDFDPKEFLPPPNLTDEEEKLRAARVEVLNKRIRRWFLYRLRKLRKSIHSAALDPTKDPYAVLLAKLSGVQNPPKARQAYQQFMREAYSEKIAPVVAERWAEQLEENPGDPDRTKEPKAGFRAKVAREVFATLSTNEQQQLGARAKEEALEKKKAFQKALADPPSAQPPDRQKCIDALPEFIGPILRGIQEYTGLHTVLVCGGPVPKYGGDLRTLHVAYGRNKTAGAHTWPQWDKPRFTNDVLNFMTEYLQTAFTPQQRSEASLMPVGTLASAKYMMPPKQDSDSDSSDSDSEPDDSDLNLDASDDEDLIRTKKKRKIDKGKEKAPTIATPSSTDSQSPAATVWCNEQGLTLDQIREKNITKHRALAEQLKATFEAKYPEMKKPERRNRENPPPPEQLETATGVVATVPNDADPTLTPVQRPKPRPRYNVASSASATTDTAEPEHVETAGGSNPMDVDTPAMPPASTETPAPSVAIIPTPPPTIPQASPTVPQSPPTQPPCSATLPDAAHATAPPCPPDAAIWFVDAHAQMTKADLGCHFDGVIAAWTRVEAASRYEQGPTKLSTINRPEQVKKWVANQRGKRQADTSTADPTAYAAGWQLWWDALQLEWRVKDGDGAWSVNCGYGGGGKDWAPCSSGGRMGY
ncbi:hypothetical protein B0H13DRAFT_2343915 [Mycena leptocephala]|nr:hypothetical protein B0H13DRAFT_2343915 [Mycena leptocephala]